MAFATSLNFTSANEDGRSELAALALSPRDHALCLTASGTRPLDLLIGNPGRITALDSNPAQNHLLALKMTAMRAFERDEYLAFVGVAHAENRLALYRRIAPDLPSASRTYWDRRARTIAGGVWHAGRWERVLRMGAWGNRLLRRRAIDRLMGADTLDRQSRIWADEFDDWKWRGTIQVLSARWFWTHIIGEPGGAFLPARDETTARLADAFAVAAGRILFRDSDFATLIFEGRHRPEGALPVHLAPEHYDTVRDRLDRIEIVTGDLAALETLDLGSFSAFSLSDFGSYCDQAGYDACWRAILSAAAPDARFCERVFMNRLEPSAAMAGRLSVDRALSDRLTAQDRAIIYSIRAGTISAEA